MSTAALASARRRRTTNDTPVPPQNVTIKTTQQESPNSSKQGLPSQSLTPLQILQIHDNKLKELERLMIEVNSEEYIVNVIEEKINEIIETKLAAFSNNLDNIISSTNSNTGNNKNASANSFDTKFQMLETSIQNNLTIQNVRMDEFKNGIHENFNTFKENITRIIDLLSAKENHISMPTISNTNLSVEKLDMVTKEVNELKLLVIKNQTLALETCTSIINMKDEFKLNNEKLLDIMDNIADLNNRQCVQSQCEQSQCGQSQCDPAQMFLQSFMKKGLFGGAKYDDNDIDDELDDNMNSDNKKLHIDLTTEQLVLDDEEIISDTNELIIDENQLQEILDLSTMEEINLNNNLLKKEVLDEIKNISALVEENNLQDNNESTNESTIESTIESTVATEL